MVLLIGRIQSVANLNTPQLSLYALCSLLCCSLRLYVVIWNVQNIILVMNNYGFAFWHTA